MFFFCQSSVQKSCHPILVTSEMLPYYNVTMLRLDFWSKISILDFWNPKNTKIEMFWISKKCYFHENEKMTSSCLFDLSSNVILIFLEHLCHLNITWFVTWPCWWRHNKVIKRFWIVSSDVPSVLKWGASVLNRTQSHLSYSNLFLWYFKKNDILKNFIPYD